MTFVASSIGNLPASPARPPFSYSEPAGLAVVIAPDRSKNHRRRCKVTHSVRDVLVCGNSLYVADEPGNAVKVYAIGGGQTEGQLQGQIADAQFLRAPVHLLAHREHLFIGRFPQTPGADQPGLRKSSSIQALALAVLSLKPAATRSSASCSPSAA